MEAGDFDQARTNITVSSRRRRTASKHCTAWAASPIDLANTSRPSNGSAGPSLWPATTRFCTATWRAAYRAAGRLAEAEACYRQALRLQPDLAPAYNNLGNVLREQGRPAEAEAPPGRRCWRVQATRTRATTLTCSYRSEASGAASARRGRFHGGPTPRRSPTPLALALLRDRKPEEAEAHCSRALRLDPDRPRLQDALGRALARQGRLTEALMAFHHAVRVDPARAETYLHLGAALRDQGELGRAVDYLRHALRLRPGLVERTTRWDWRSSIGASWKRRPTPTASPALPAGLGLRAEPSRRPARRVGGGGKGK